MEQQLCRIDDLDNPGTKAFDTESGSIFIVRQDDQVYAYKNSCPHRGIRLEWQPDQFLDYEKQYIQCSTHGALFTLDSGKCIVGPCNGQSLQSLQCRTDDGIVYVTHAA